MELPTANKWNVFVITPTIHANFRIIWVILVSIYLIFFFVSFHSSTICSKVSPCFVLCPNFRQRPSTLFLTSFYLSSPSRFLSFPPSLPSWRWSSSVSLNTLTFLVFAFDIFWFRLSCLLSVQTIKRCVLSTLRNRSVQPFLVSSTFLLQSLVRKFAPPLSITLSLKKGYDIFTLPVATTKSQLTLLCSLGVDVGDEAKDTGATVSTNQKLRQKPVWHACAHFFETING